jgi:riboflavin kinase / FMN adenylyltransferase
MRIIRSLDELRSDPTVLTIGAFDGVHLGHKWLIEQVIQRARSLNVKSMVLTFDPRPLVVLRPGNLELSDGAAKERLISDLNPDVLVLMPFTLELSRIPARDFLQSVLDHVDLAEIWVGMDFAFGHNREGTVDFLIRNGADEGFDVHVVSRRRQGDHPISSTRVRELISIGDVSGASQIMGHAFGFEGSVVPGFARGRELGIPTANIQRSAAQLLPATGIYAGYVCEGEQRRPSAISVGTNPMFDGKEITVEAHILDFDGDLLGHTLEVEFTDRLRDEQTFDSISALLEQIRRDVEAVRVLLGAR